MNCTQVVESRQQNLTMWARLGSVAGTVWPKVEWSEAVLVTQPDQYKERAVCRRLPGFLRLQTTSSPVGRGKAFKPGERQVQRQERENLSLFQMSEHPLGNREAELMQLRSPHA